jgi:hypothetical protein
MNATKRMLLVAGIVVLTLFLIGVGANLIIDVHAGVYRAGLNIYIACLVLLALGIGALWRALNKP